MNPSLRIAFFVGCFPVVSETFILRQIAGLLDLGHDVQIYADTRADAAAPLQPEVAKYQLLDRTTYMDLPPETVPWEMPVWPVTGRTWPPGAIKPVPNVIRLGRAVPLFLRCFLRTPRLALSVLNPAEYGYQAASLSALHRLARLASTTRKFDVLHAHFGPVGNSFRFAREQWRTPLIVSFHGYDFSTLPRQEGNRMYERLFETADAVTVNSDYTGQCVQRLGCPPMKLRKIPVGLDLTAFPFRERTLHPGEPIRLLTVGRLVEIKGHDYVIHAVAKLREQSRPVLYDIVGDGPLRPRLERLIVELGLQGIVTLHGSQDSMEVRRRMGDAHLFVLASVSIEGDQEGQGLVLQEAQACGLPVVATQHGAFPEGLLAGKSGFLVPERDVPALAAQLDLLIEHPEAWPVIGRAGRAFVEQNYDIGLLNDRLAGLYCDVRAGFDPLSH